MLRDRYRKILRFAAFHLIQTWWFELFLPRMGLARLAARGRARRMRRMGQRFHTLAIELGGLMIKVGQFLSSRLDVLPPEITKELESLQDEVQPVPFADIRALAESELGVPLEDAFAFVDQSPVAAASLGQAHRARLADIDADMMGFSRAIVKIQRPGIDQIVEVDLAALRRVGRWLTRVRLVRERVDAPALVEEFAVTSLQEIDYVHEAVGAGRFSADLTENIGVSVPGVVWERTTPRVLTLEDVTAIKINDVDALRAAGIDPGAVATHFAEVMFDQFFVGGFFHADPHPGNIFVTPAHAGDGNIAGTANDRSWTLTLIDFGMMGEVPAGLSQGLRRVFIAAATRNGKNLVKGISDVGVLLPSADTAELERAMTELFARFGGMRFAELKEVGPREFREFAKELGELVRSLPFQLPEDFLLMVRALSLTSGLCSALDPTFNIWDAVEPYAERLISQERGPVIQELSQQLASAANVAMRLPGRLDELAARIEDGRMAVQTPGLERRVVHLERMGRRLVSVTLFAGLLIAGGTASTAADDLWRGTDGALAAATTARHTGRTSETVCLEVTAGPGQ